MADSKHYIMYEKTFQAQDLAAVDWERGTFQQSQANFGG